MHPTIRAARYEQHRRALEALEARKAEMLAELAGLETQILAEQEEICRYAPITMLPDDVGVEILKAAYQHDFPHCRNHSGLPNDSPIPLSQVNRCWRRLSLSVPSIWSCIHVTIEQRNRTRMVELFLERSRNTPISIFFCCYTKDFETSLEYEAAQMALHPPFWRQYAPAWKILLEHAARWKNCAFYALQRNFVDRFVGDMDGLVFPLLEYLGLYLRPENRLSQAYIQPSFTAPRLRHIRLSHAHFFTSHDIHPLYGGITELVVSDMWMPTSHLHHFFRSEASGLNRLMLANLRLAGDFEGLPWESGVTNTYPLLPGLRSLIFADVDGPAWGIFKSAPSLTTLHISGKCDLLFEIVDKHEKFPSILRLEIQSAVPTEQYRGPTDKDSSGWTAAFPNLETLLIHDWDGTSDLLKRMMELGEHRNIAVLPTLRSLVVEKEYSGTLKTLVEWREEHRSPLNDPTLINSLCVICAPPPDPSDSSLPFREVNFCFPLPCSFWDGCAHKPRIIPWDGEWDAYDQFWPW